jgi:proteic killer suppression protein
VIRSFKNKTLRAFYQTGDGRKLSVQNVDRLRRILLALDDAEQPEDMNLPGFRFHSLTKDQKGRFSIRVTGNWRVTFGWDQGATDVDLEDYH